MSKPKLATVVLGGCTGCHLSLLDAHEGLLDLLGEADLVHSPLTAGDAMPACDVVLVEGAVTNAHDEETARAARAAAGTVVAIGSCATLGGVGGLRNLMPLSEVLGAVYGGMTSGNGLAERVRPLSAVIDVDVSVPGCSPDTATLVAAVRAVLSGEPYETPRRNLCAECARSHSAMLTHSRDFVSDSVYGLMELDAIDPDLCFLEQGVICMGPMTRSGCGARCTEANVPCRGCVGPSRPDFEQGAKTIDALAAVLPPGAIMCMEDLVGIGYRFSLPSSIIPGAVTEGGEGDE